MDNGYLTDALWTWQLCTLERLHSLTAGAICETWSVHGLDSSPTKSGGTLYGHDVGKVIRDVRLRRILPDPTSAGFTDGGGVGGGGGGSGRQD